MELPGIIWLGCLIINIIIFWPYPNPSVEVLKNEVSATKREIQQDWYGVINQSTTDGFVALCLFLTPSILQIYTVIFLL